MNPIPGDASRYWHHTRNLTLVLLALWFVASFTCIYFAAEMQSWSFFGWPLSFYALAQGLLLFFVVLIGIYVRVMNRLDNTSPQPHEQEQEAAS